MCWGSVRVCCQVRDFGLRSRPILVAVSSLKFWCQGLVLAYFCIEKGFAQQVYSVLFPNCLRYYFVCGDKLLLYLGHLLICYPWFGGLLELLKWFFLISIIWSILVRLIPCRSCGFEFWFVLFYFLFLTIILVSSKGKLCLVLNPKAACQRRSNFQQYTHVPS